MEQLFFVHDTAEHGELRQAYVRAESSEDAMAAAYLLGINPSKDSCSACEHIPGSFVGRLLSRDDCDKLDQIRERAMGEVVRLVQEIANIRDGLDDIVVRFNFAGGERTPATAPVE